MQTRYAMNKNFIRLCSAAALAAIIAGTQTSCSDVAVPEKRKKAQELTLPGTTEYIESHYCKFVDLCCPTCNSLYVGELQRWDATRQAYNTWRSYQTALEAALAEQAAQQALNIALTLVNRDLSGRAFDGINDALTAWKSANRLGELSAQLLVLRESISGAIGLLTSGLVLALQGKADFIDVIERARRQLVWSSIRLDAIAAQAIVRQGQGAVSGAVAVRNVATALRGALNAVADFQRAFPDIADLWRQIDDAKNRMDLVAVSFCSAAARVTDCCQNQCGCAGGTARCGASCVDLQTDSTNCGTCGNTCAPVASCVSGACQCTPVTCTAAGAECGSIPDGCGSNLDCGSCGGAETCGGAGTPNRCGCPVGTVDCNGSCVGNTCAAPATFNTQTCQCECPPDAPWLNPSTQRCESCPQGMAWDGAAHECAFEMQWSYAEHVAGCYPPSWPNPTSADGNPYRCDTSGPVHTDLPFGSYRITTTAIGPQYSNPSAQVWLGDDSGGARYQLGSNVGDSIDVTLTFGRLTLYTWDWFAGDNSPAYFTRARITPR